MSAYNFRLHDAVVEALEAALKNESLGLATARNADFGELRYRIGRYFGLHEAIEIAEETRKKMLQE